MAGRSGAGTILTGNAKNKLLALSAGVASQIEPKHCIAVASKLASENETGCAFQVLDAGLNAHRADVTLKAVRDAIQKADARSRWNLPPIRCDFDCQPRVTP